MTKRKTTLEFAHEVVRLTNHEYEVVGKYVNAHTKIEIRHCRCNQQYLVRPHDFLAIKGHHQNRCPYCYPNGSRLTNERYQKKLDQLTDCEYQLVSDYHNTMTPVTLRHCCGAELTVIPHNFNRGFNRCQCNQIERKIELA